VGLIGLPDVGCLMTSEWMDGWMDGWMEVYWFGSVNSAQWKTIEFPFTKSSWTI